MHASRLYATIDWCAGVFKTPSGPRTVVVSSEGAGYVPPGVFLPRSARLLFSDPALSEAFRARWFAWVNPALTMLAYAAACTELDPNLELYAVAVSTDHGGSAIAARDAGVPHYEDCSLLVSPIKADAPAPALDGTRMHRLEALDRGEYARLTSTPNRSESWSTTEAAVRVTLSRASTLLGFSIPPVVRQITQVLEKGESVADDRWAELEMVRVNAILDSASQRPGRMLGSDGASPYARAYHNLARLAELLALWRGNDPQHAEIAIPQGRSLPRPGCGRQEGSRGVAATNNRIRVDETSITETAQSVALSLAEAAKPGPVPTATGASLSTARRPAWPGRSPRMSPPRPPTSRREALRDWPSRRLRWHR